LRSLSTENFLVVDRSSGSQVLAEVDFDSAPLTIYPGAIYMLESESYQVEELDFSNRKAYVTPVKAEYYTEAVLYTNLKILDVFQSDPDVRKDTKAEFHEGEVHVVNHVPGFKKIRFYTMENLGYGEVSLPDQQMHTTAFWITVNPEHACEIGMTVQDVLTALAGAGYAMHHMASFLLMCEPRDLGRAIGDPYADFFLQSDRSNWKPQLGKDGMLPDSTPGMVFRPTLFLYDAYPGGIGLSPHLFTRRRELMEGAISLIERCSCEHGCPSCVGPSGEAGEMARTNAGRLLRWILFGVD